jgi:hypothetical protein
MSPRCSAYRGFLLAVGLVLLAACASPTPGPTATPTKAPTATPTAMPTDTPTPAPTETPTAAPKPTDVPVVMQSWQDVDFVLSDTCGRCHNGETLKGDLDLTSYASAVAGGSSGPGIVAGNPDASGIVRKQQIGGHYAQLTDAQLEALRDWITAGAVESAP